MLGIAFPLPSELPIAISNIEFLKENNTQEQVFIRVYLDVFNPNDVALTASKLEYDLFADGVLVGTAQLDSTTIPVTG